MNGVKVKTIIKRVKSEMEKRMSKLLDSGLSEKNLMRAINSYVIPVAAYVMNVCKVSETDLTELDIVIKRALRERNVHGRQCSEERLYLNRKMGGRVLKSLRDVY